MDASLEKVGNNLVLALSILNTDAVGQTGKTMTAAQQRLADGKYWDNGTTDWTSVTPVYNSMSEISATDQEGLYEYTLTGGSQAADERYRVTFLESGGSPNINFAESITIANFQITSTDINSLRDAILLYKPITDGVTIVTNKTDWITTNGYQGTVLEALCFGFLGSLSFKLIDGTQKLQIALDSAHTESPDKRIFIGTGKDQGGGNFDIVGDDIAEVGIQEQS